jgi:hypothetical protein
MNGSRQSDRFVVPANPPEKAAAAEAGGGKGANQGNMAGLVRRAAGLRCLDTAMWSRQAA